MCGDVRFETLMSPTAASGLTRSLFNSLKLMSAMPRHPAATPKSRRSSMGPPPLTSCALKPCRSTSTAASTTKATLTQFTSADSCILSRAAGCRRHSSAPASRPSTRIFPAEPCQILPEKSSACTSGGKKRVTIDAGTAEMTTASIAARPARTSGQYERDRGADLASRLSERDAGIHHSRPGGAIHGDRFDREPMTLIERGEPGDQGIEGRRFQLHTDAGPVGLSPAQRVAEAGLSADPVDQNHRRFARVRGRLTARRADLRSVRLHPRQIRPLRFIALDGARNRGLQRHQYSQHQDENRHGDSADGHHTLLTLLQTGIPGTQFVQKFVHRCSRDVELRSCMCASTPLATGVEDWISAVIPCLTMSCDSCESAARLGALTFMSRDCSR